MPRNIWRAASEHFIKIVRDTFQFGTTLAHLDFHACNFGRIGFDRFELFKEHTAGKDQEGDSDNHENNDKVIGKESIAIGVHVFLQESSRIRLFVFRLVPV